MRCIAVYAFNHRALVAANLLWLMGAADQVRPSFLVPFPALWSLNGEPMVPHDSLTKWSVGDQ